MSMPETSSASVPSGSLSPPSMLYHALLTPLVASVRFSHDSASSPSAVHAAGETVMFSAVGATVSRFTVSVLS